MKDIKPCPFCGGEAKLIKTDLESYVITCTKCPTNYGRAWFWKKKDAISAWNKRVTDN